ncbi:class I SAM-dependent methyltransferase [Nevskia soli]|uniref:class I SAM-dependent methyltransferase n=1 Tax=Nevskia soli TaxID=418856 RepID=UPI0004A6BADE|nr:class I SAM-dependent methyltransferase [Nevskia soli]
MQSDFDYVPKSFFLVPDRLKAANAPVGKDELSSAEPIRQRFLFKNDHSPYLDDVTRAFRLLTGAKTYLEIGIYDRGNLAYVSTLLDPSALIIGLDIQANEEHESRLRQFIKPGQKYEEVIGNSQDDQTVQRVSALLRNRKVDALFIDGDHTAAGALSDYARYADFVNDDGIIFFHDALWEGNEQYKGVSAAMMCIDRLDPVYCIIGAEPVHRYIPPMFRKEVWGCVGVVLPKMMAHRKTSFE